LTNGKKLYFVSDAHLGLPNEKESLVREKKLVAWLNEIEPTAEAIYLMGDIFDFWFEYKKVVPKGFTRLLGKLAHLTDNGIPVYFFVGNHDLWEYGYFEQEIGLKVFHSPQSLEIDGKRFYLAHGDGLGPFDKGYVWLKKLFTNSVAQWFFRWLHPDIGVGLAHYWSHKSRYAEGEDHLDYLGEEKESLISHSKELLKTSHYDFFIYGHRHVALEKMLSDKTKLIYLGDWLNNFSYAEFDGEQVTLNYFKK
jgi:UDP-2,3-diacylglucosamine hydrolase